VCFQHRGALGGIELALTGEVAEKDGDADGEADAAQRQLRAWEKLEK
jgi:hypothetical protein